ncbi:MAG: hypothetical protein WAO08_28680, partial [Hyphomicrobiaceae bacterium]
QSPAIGFAQADHAIVFACWVLTVSPAVPNAASTSVFCPACAETLPMDEVEGHCVRVLRKLLPGGRFEALRGAS